MESKTPISIIVAIAENFAIGRDNQLLWHISDDLRRFKALTTGHKVIMGKKTYESLPRRPLPNRVNIVITDKPEERFDGCITVYSIEEAISNCDSDRENFIIGGGSVYKQFLPLAQRLYLTIVNEEFQADTFFPEINFKEWELMEIENKPYDPELGFSYSFQTYVRIR